ncbi:MAG: AmmeMemoRadiSam system radical SAM enzyme, partial [Candidatus Coatesbacteria bacterium]|nr:AmmeMemoRadiSam system radical SAM enzyme [Candidatus Coatesbacteria bacterium]
MAKLINMLVAKYYRTLENNLIECNLCPRNCKIPEGQRGFCNIRINSNGILYTEGYGKTISVSMDPIEKKPLYHFFPGSKILSIGPNGCNLDCQWCQNWQISRRTATTQFYSPNSIINLAETHNSIGIAYTYSEPIIWFEYIIDVSQQARASGLKNVLVTNGYINEEPLNSLLPYIDAINLDIKSMNPDFYKNICKGNLEPVLRTASLAYRHGIHLEITNLVIPGYNSKDEEFQLLGRWIKEYLSVETVLHLSA